MTKLSPYISRGVITTKQVAKALLHKGYEPYGIEGFLKDFVWRDYFQQVWVELGSKINDDIFASINGLKSFSNICGGKIKTIS